MIVKGACCTYICQRRVFTSISRLIRGIGPGLQNERDILFAVGLEVNFPILRTFQQFDIFSEKKQS